MHNKKHFKVMEKKHTLFYVVKHPNHKPFCVSFSELEKGFTVSVTQLGQRRTYEFFFSSLELPTDSDAIDFALFSIQDSRKI